MTPETTKLSALSRDTVLIGDTSTVKQNTCLRGIRRQHLDQDQLATIRAAELMNEFKDSALKNTQF
jgi:hypothetical protein